MIRAVNGEGGRFDYFLSIFALFFLVFELFAACGEHLRVEKADSERLCSSETVTFLK